ncbi:hypothetical protein TIFTF001_029804 [Ficus carica]|uniref:Uncharacterized protein n=1 Tax=Ficus carica TaxID=3494 RepID=A0AA88DSL7_FICCA|nr:hypothetical protein TIFTF001_029804 [Ficus carica]
MFLIPIVICIRLEGAVTGRGVLGFPASLLVCELLSARHRRSSGLGWWAQGLWWFASDEVIVWAGLGVCGLSLVAEMVKWTGGWFSGCSRRCQLLDWRGAAGRCCMGVAGVGAVWASLIRWFGVAGRVWEQWLSTTGPVGWLVETVKSAAGLERRWMVAMVESAAGRDRNGEVGGNGGFSTWLTGQKRMKTKRKWGL